MAFYLVFVNVMFFIYLFASLNLQKYFVALCKNTVQVIHLKVDYILNFYLFSLNYDNLCYEFECRS